MFRIPYDVIITKIKEQSKLTDAEINNRINDKLEQLSGLISKEGAAHIVANDLGVKLYEQISGPIKIKNLLLGMRSIETAGKVLRKFDTIEFEKEKIKGRVASLIIGDETGQIRLVLWNQQALMLGQIKEGDIVRVKRAYVKQNSSGKLEVHLGERGILQVNPPDILINQISEPDNNTIPRKWIFQVTQNDFMVEILGTIVQIFNPNFFEICPVCQKRIKQKENIFICEEHGEVTPDYSYVINAILDDGTGTMRCVFFRSQAEQLTKKTNAEILETKNVPLLFEQIKKEVLGTQLKVQGKVMSNSVFNRLELISRDIAIPDPEEELMILEEEERRIIS